MAWLHFPGRWRTKSLHPEPVGRLSAQSVVGRFTSLFYSDQLLNNSMDIRFKGVELSTAALLLALSPETSLK